VAWELKFGSWVLLQPERINAYAQVVIQTLRADEHQRGCPSMFSAIWQDNNSRCSPPRIRGTKPAWPGASKTA
jgi:hypothetical protein